VTFGELGHFLFINLSHEKGDAIMKAHLMTTVMIGLLLLSFFPIPTFAGVEPSPWHDQVNRLNSVMNDLDSINRRLADALVSSYPSKLKMPSPEGVMGRLEVMANQLLVLNNRIMIALSGVPMKPEPAEIKIPLMDINRDAMETVKIARMGMRYQDQEVSNAFTKVQTAAENIIVTVKEWIMNQVDVFLPYDETVCFIGHECTIEWDTGNIQNDPTVWLQVVYPDGSGAGQAFYGIPNTGSYHDFVPDPSWADPSVYCQPFRIKVFVDPNTDDYSGVSGLFKVGILGDSCHW